MKLRKEIITHSTDGTQIMVSADKNIFSGIVKNNSTAAFIVDMLKNDVTAEEIKAAMLEKYDAPEEVISADVDETVSKLKAANLITE